MKWWHFSVWFASGAILLWDGIFDTATSTNHAPIFDILEAVIGFGLILLLILKIHNEGVLYE